MFAPDDGRFDRRDTSWAGLSTALRAEHAQHPVQDRPISPRGRPLPSGRRSGTGITGASHAHCSPVRSSIVASALVAPLHTEQHTNFETSS